MSGAGEGALFIICALPLAGVDLVPNGEPGNVRGRQIRIGFSDRVWRDQPRGHPEADPDT